MKPSEAMLLGAMMSPQIRGTLATDKGTCAVGSMVEAVGMLSQWKAIAQLPSAEQCGKWNAFWDQFPFRDFTMSTAKHPVVHRWMNINSIITNLNDSHKWTREAIAAWVATQEVIHDTTPVEQPTLESTCVSR